MNIARLFSAYRLLESELRRERVLHRREQMKWDRERQKFIDALARASNKPPVFNRPEVSKDEAPGLALGPSQIAAKRAREEAEVLERAAAARRNGNNT
jgi:hypothetical protein